ncbi:MAG: hypothetical protein GAK43_01821 [Stenotrophomonas maltophilia]|nr:MAG: hypothetical protein GAK43_01821 [Stenotrophomonas maltophilia]
MSDQQPFANADADWLELITQARAWLSGPIGGMMLAEEQRLLVDELDRHFGGYMVHYGPHAELPASTGNIQRGVRLGPPLPGVEIACDECAWPLGEHAADLVLLQHGLDFCLSPHRLLREAARSVRPGGHLLIIGVNPLSTWGVRRYFARDGLRRARCIAPGRVCDWLNLLGFALEKRRFGCYRPPLASMAWQARLARMEGWGGALKGSGAGFYLLVARKLVMGLRPLQQSKREPRGQLIPLPVAKVSRRDSES